MCMCRLETNSIVLLLLFFEMLNLKLIYLIRLTTIKPQRTFSFFLSSQCWDHKYKVLVIGPQVPMGTQQALYSLSHTPACLILP